MVEIDHSKQTKGEKIMTNIKLLSDQDTQAVGGITVTEYVVGAGLIVLALQAAFASMGIKL